MPRQKPPTPRTHLRGVRGSAHHNAKLKPEDIPEIRKLLSQGYSTWKVGVLFGVTRACIQDVSSGKNWKHV